eukprot:1139264-Pelagomonas_calceolata.AAC.2
MAQDWATSSEAVKQSCKALMDDKQMVSDDEAGGKQRGLKPWQSRHTPRVDACTSAPDLVHLPALF